CQRQPAHDGPVVRRGAGDRLHRGAGGHLDRPHRPGHRRGRARGRAPLAQQEPFGHGLSRQGEPPGGETLVNAIASTLRLRRSTPRALTALAAGAMLALAATAPAAAVTIERVVSPGGIEAWLVHDRTLPLIALELAIRGSADQDPADRPG